jgi:N-acetyl sugar amidotransferase
MPDTKPYLRFTDNGLCSGCVVHKRKNQYMAAIDWQAREAEFESLVLEVRSKQSPFYDVLVPVSGGKDSITQIHRLLKYSLRVLAVNVDYGIKTDIGWHNLNLVSNMGANLVIYRPEQSLHRRLIRIGLEDFGDPDLLSHTLLYAFPLHMALQFKIPLVLNGENSAFEYGGDERLAEDKSMTREWFAKYVANAGRDAAFISRNYDIPIQNLRLYEFPENLACSTTQAVFMSYYFHWDSEAHLRIALKHGFKTLNGPGEGTYRNYVGIDEKINRIHQYLKVLKFGYGRATDHACEDIRNGRISREDAKALVRQHDLTDLSDYFTNDFVNYIGVTREQFFEILEKHRNLQIWQRNGVGHWYIPNYLENSS